MTHVSFARFESGEYKEGSKRLTGNAWKTKGGDNTN